MKEQEEDRNRVEEEKKRKADLQTGGGFDLSKMRKKSSIKSNGSFKEVSSKLSSSK